MPGLIVWAGKHKRTFRLVRRIGGKLVKRTLKARSLAQARREAIAVWKSLRPLPAGPGGAPTLKQALDAYLAARPLSQATQRNYARFLSRCVPDLLPRRLDVLALDRAGFRQRMLEAQRQHGAASMAMVVRCISAVYNWCRKALPDLPESPTAACEVPRLKPRDWALSDDELRQWWQRVRGLPPVRRVWWLTALLTGARAGSITALKWDSVDFQRKLIRFWVAKGNRPYTVPMPDRLAQVLAGYRERDWLPNEDGWLFPSPRRPGRPLLAPDGRDTGAPHRLRHTMRTRLAEAGCPPDLAHIALGHALPGVSGGYVTAHLLIEAVRPVLNTVAGLYAEVLGWDSAETAEANAAPAQCDNNGRQETGNRQQR